MASRRGGRETCLQSLYLWDNCHSPIEEAWNAASAQSPDDFAKKLFDGVTSEIKRIDALLRQYSRNWTLERMSVVDRNVLRIAVYEILFAAETPLNVIINEAVEVAKSYSTEESGKFVNGILDNLKKERKTAKASND